MLNHKVSFFLTSDQTSLFFLLHFVELSNHHRLWIFRIPPSVLQSQTDYTILRHTLPIALICRIKVLPNLLLQNDATPSRTTIFQNTCCRATFFRTNLRFFAHVYFSVKTYLLDLQFSKNQGSRLPNEVDWGGGTSNQKSCG